MQMNTIRQSEKFEEQLVSLFHENRALLDASCSDAVNKQRTSGLDAFLKVGIPSRFNENYKYTNLIPAFTSTYKHYFTRERAFQAATNSFQCDVPNLDTYNIYVVNGWLDENRSNLHLLPKGVVVSGFSQQSTLNDILLQEKYGTASASLADPMVYLNNAYAQDGVFIRVADGVLVDKPIQVVNIFSSEVDSAIYQRNFVSIGKSAQAKLLYCDHTLSESKFLINSVTEVFVEDNGNFEFYNIQNLHNQTTAIITLAIAQARDTRIQTNHLNLHTGLTRNNTFVALNGENSEANMFGLYICDKKQHVDNYTYISHNAPSCTSTELYKGVMDDSSTGAFSGRIYVAQDAQKTNAFQRNNNLLLTSDARINSKPQLEIYANDVKCSHGATVGQLDDKALFYLRSRGVGLEESRILLMYAFAYEVIEKIQVPALKEQIRDLVEKTVRGELNKCTSCVVCGKAEM